MKTMKKGSDIIRVKEVMVQVYLAAGYQYCPKSEWKELRDAESGSLEA